MKFFRIRCTFFGYPQEYKVKVGDKTRYKEVADYWKKVVPMAEDIEIEEITGNEDERLRVFAGGENGVFRVPTSESLSGFWWSFSALQSYAQCPHMFYRRVICHDKGRPNEYSTGGVIVHKVLEELEKGELKLDNACRRYSELAKQAATPVRDNDYERALRYFGCLDPHDLDGCRILQTETFERFELDGRQFCGVIDLLLQDENDDITIVDHKSHRKLLRRDGLPLKNEEENLQMYKRQMYIYAAMVYQKYGRYPVRFVINHFYYDHKTIIPFSMEEYQEAREWAMDIIHRAEQDVRHEMQPSGFYCSKLCRYRGDCGHEKHDAIAV